MTTGCSQNNFRQTRLVPWKQFVKPTLDMHINIRYGLLVDMFIHLITGLDQKTHCSAGPVYIRVMFLMYFNNF